MYFYLSQSSNIDFCNFLNVNFQPIRPQIPPSSPQLLLKIQQRPSARHAHDLSEGMLNKHNNKIERDGGAQFTSFRETRCTHSSSSLLWRAQEKTVSNRLRCCFPTGKGYCGEHTVCMVVGLFISFCLNLLERLFDHTFLVGPFSIKIVKSTESLRSSRLFQVGRRWK